MTAFAGCDFDTHAIHVVLILEEGPPEYHRFELEGHDAFERSRDVRDKMPSRGWWADQGVIALAIEEPMGRGSVVQKLNVVQGAVLSCLPRELLVNPMRPSTWRVEAGMKGNAPKEEVARFVGSRIWPDSPLPLIPASTWPQDACDAYCLALAAEKLTVMA